jgi:uncharacterized protein VirK/YbjX
LTKHEMIGPGGLSLSGRPDISASALPAIEDKTTKQRSLVGYLLHRIGRARARDQVLFVVDALKHLSSMMPLLLARQGSNLRGLVVARPEVFLMARAHYLAENWGARTRFARIIDHCRIVAAIGGPLDFPPEKIVYLLPLKFIDPRYRISLDQPRWLLSEGQYAFSVWENIDRIFTLAFCLSSEEGRLIAYVGGVQGRSQIEGEPDILQRYRVFTKLAHGTRPRDFIVRAFKMFCASLGVAEIRAIAEENQPERQTDPLVKLPYNQIWRERGGVDNGAGFFVMAPRAERRTAEEIPPKKRAMYRERYAMFDMLEAAFKEALSECKVLFPTQLRAGQRG